jgi:hypothetical protein
MRVLTTTVAGLAAATFFALPADAQVFLSKSNQVPSGNQNGSSSENVDFSDVDGDGDYDVVMADGGDDGNDRNRIWINQGGLQGGTIGFFSDDTGARIPSGQDTSRDIDFIDIDNDGDEDIYVSNTSTVTNQSNRWWINQGGLQAGTAGFFVEDGSRWVNVGVNNGSTSSSVPGSFVIPGSGFVDWSCDCIFADLDADGDMDLVHTSYGAPNGGGFSGFVPSRLFLNDGGGNFEEYNPSGFQLSGQTISNGDPALWAQGTHQHDTQQTNGTQSDIAATPLGAEVGDVDGDWDIDILIGAREEQPRMFLNRYTQNGDVLSRFLDFTYRTFTDFAVGGGNYEQEMGDFDNDNDLDIYGLNWASGAGTDVTIKNPGNGLFGSYINLQGSGSDDNEGDFLDYDNDGDIDLYICNFQGQDRLYRNNGAPNYDFTNVTSGNVPNAGFETGLGADSVDIDNDGDYDVLVANDNNTANRLQVNQTNTADTTAPRVIVEEITGGAGPQRVRAKVFSNTNWDVSRYHDTELVYTVDGGSQQTVDMMFAGGQSWIATLPSLSGSIDYFARSSDDYNNTGTSSTFNYNAGGGSVNYCTAGTSNNGCQAMISTTGTPSATGATGFSLVATGVEGAKDGLFFYGVNGRQANSWGSGTSFQCCIPPVLRAGLLSAVGTNGACDGSFSQDLHVLWTAIPAKNPGSGTVVQNQLWYRDPMNTSNQTTSLSNAVEYTVGP